MHIVWFKRDLHIYDHEALTQAAKHGPVLPLYIFEPDLWNQPDMSYRHYLFLQDCLSELSQDLEELGQQLVITVGNAVNILEGIGKYHTIEGLWSHQETWNGWTYKRDKAVKRWCKSLNVPWHEPPQNDVVRGLYDCNAWAARWYHQMTIPLIDRPLNLINTVKGIPIDSLPSYGELNLRQDISSQIQKGGRIEGLKVLNSFLYDREEKYKKGMSSPPVTTFAIYSRLSAYLAFGTLSIMREVFQACEKCNHEIKQMPRGQKEKWPSTMRSVLGRLCWHCYYFIQKLKNELHIEFKNMHPAYNGLRKLWQTSYMHNRVRMIVVSFLVKNLRLNWYHGERWFWDTLVDADLANHSASWQWIAGCGADAPPYFCIFNPIAQGYKLDPDGKYVCKYIPEIASLPNKYLFSPWEASEAILEQSGIGLGLTYPRPIVDLKESRELALTAFKSQK